MVELLLKILGEGLKAWNSAEGKELYRKYTKIMEEYNEELDRKSRTGQYSQYALDRLLRDANLIADAYYKYIITKPE